MPTIDDKKGRFYPYICVEIICSDLGFITQQFFTYEYYDEKDEKETNKDNNDIKDNNENNDNNENSVVNNIEESYENTNENIKENDENTNETNKNNTNINNTNTFNINANNISPENKNKISHLEKFYSRNKGVNISDSYDSEESLDQNQHRIKKNIELLDLLFKFLESKEDLHHTLVGYFMRVLTFLLNKNTEIVINITTITLKEIYYLFNL